MEHKFGYSGQNIEEYSAILENKLDSIQSYAEESKTQAAEDENEFETDFIGGRGDLQNDL